VLNRTVLCLLIVTLALLASPGLAPPASAAQTLVVDDDYDPCEPAINIYTSIQQALGDASSGDTIRVCEGDYWETQIQVGHDYLTITGPGATPADDGVATVHLSFLATLFVIFADYVVVQGLDLDAAPPNPGAMTQAIQIVGSSVTIEHNEIRNATRRAVFVGDIPTPRHVRVLSNNIHDSQDAVVCNCDDSVVAGNTVNVTDFAVDIVGDGGNVTNNTIVHGRVNASGDDSFISTNQITGPASGPLLRVSGSRVGVTDNTLSGTTGYGIQALIYQGSESMDVTILRNTFTDIRTPIYLSDWDPNDPFTLTAGIGGSASDANTFVDSGGSLGDGDQLLSLVNVTMDVNAQYNNWGLCSLAEIEQEIYHQVDDPALGFVDFDPFIAPSSCSATPTPTPTATPTRTPTPTPTPGATATPTPGDTRTVTIPPAGWVNFAWTGASSPQTVADCFGAGNIAVMYRLDAATQTFQRWIRGREDLSNMGEILRYDALLALNAGAQPATCTMPVPQGGPGVTSTIIPAGGWLNFSGNFNAPAGEVAQACGEGNITVMYRLDAATQTFQRWVRGRPELSNMTDVQPYDALLALTASGQPANCTFPIIMG
jgi:hypothetical protein